VVPCKLVNTASWEVTDLANIIPSLDSPNSSHGKSYVDIVAASSSATTVIVEDLPKVAQWQKRRGRAYVTPSSWPHRSVPHAHAQQLNVATPWPLGTPRPSLLDHNAWSSTDKRVTRGRRQVGARGDWVDPLTIDLGLWCYFTRSNYKLIFECTLKAYAWNY
jgi:hypothetical protein